MHNIHLSSIDLNLLVLFHTLYLERSVTGTGKKLGKTQSAISHALERLRGIFDDPLFIRTSAGMVPTDRAKEIAPQLKEVFETLTKVISPIDEFDPRKIQRSFKISMSDYCEMVLLPPLMKRLAQEAPGIVIEILSPATAPMKEGLEQGIFELVVGNKDTSAGMYQQKLFDDDFVCLTRKNEDGKVKMNLQRYLDSKHVLFAPMGNTDRLITETLKKKRLKRKVVLQVPHLLVIPKVIGHTDFIGTLPRKIAEAFVTENVVISKPPLSFPSLDVMQYWHELTNKDIAHQWLRRILKEIST